MPLQILVDMTVYRCDECGLRWAVPEHFSKTGCPGCFSRRLAAAVERAEEKMNLIIKQDRIIRGLRGALSRARRVRARTP